MKHRYLVLAAFCVGTTFQSVYAQTPAKEIADYAYMVTSSDTVTVAYNQFTTISVAGTKNFSAKSNNEWITVQKVSQSSLAVFCKTNENLQNRVGSIQITSEDGKTTKKITVIQTGKNTGSLIPDNNEFPAPLMGWKNNEGQNETVIMQQAQAIANMGLKSSGYYYINLGNKTFTGRGDDGKLIESTENYPKGVKAVVDNLHKAEFKTGLQTNADQNQKVGMLGFEQKDCDYFFKTLGFDFVKVDFAEVKSKEEIEKICKAIKSTEKKNIDYAVNAQAYPGTWVHEFANSWQTVRNTSSNWESVKNAINANLYMSAYAYDGHYNDMDVLHVGETLNEEEEKTNFGMWCMLNSPLMIKGDLTKLNAKTLSLIKNKELIDLDQKATVQQAYVTQRSNGCYVLAKDIDKDKTTLRAIAVYNPTDHAQNIVVSMASLDLAGTVKVHDVFSHKDLAEVKDNMIVNVEAHDTHIYILDAENRTERQVYEAETGYIAAYQKVNAAGKTGEYVANDSCSGGMKVTSLGFSKDNSLVWKNVISDKGGKYNISVDYTCDSDKEFTVEVNGTPVKTAKVNSGSASKVGTLSITTDLKKGKNNIALYNTKSAMPDIDVMYVRPYENPQLFVEAENFNLKGGWKVDQQFMDIMGSPYLNAHGMGEPVEDATTEIEIPASKTYHVYARTYNWTSPWTTKEGPGKFQISVDGKTMETVLGCKGNKWEWQYAGEVTLKEGKHALALHDLTGFNGRVDAIYFNSEKVAPPAEVKALGKFRRTQLNIPNTPEIQKEFDLVVCGGGIAGMCAAMAAARQGMQVALINDRPVLGGNNSAEVRVHLGGRIEVGPYFNLGNLIKEFGHSKVGNAMPAENYEDEKKMNWIRSEKNISLFLCNRVNQVHIEDDQIDYVIGQNIETGVRTLFKAPLFVDCTGDGTVGVLAGADYRMGREAKAEFGESKAPEVADKMTMGNSNQWYASELNQPSSFPVFEYGVEFNENNKQAVSKGDWDWENGMRQNQITEHERIRDYGLMVVYSNWSFLKNKYSKKSQFAKKKLTWVAFIGGKRESRRLMGDYILSGTDIINRNVQKDFTAGTSWTMDLHYPVQKNENDFNGEAFKSWADHVPAYSYPVPYRCLYSRNVNNLFMAGRDISVTHMALGTTRVMRTTGMLGEVVGLAASVCHKHNALPREVYTTYFEDLKVLMKKGAGKQGLRNNQTFNNGTWLGN